MAEARSARGGTHYAHKSRALTGFDLATAQAVKELQAALRSHASTSLALREAEKLRKTLDTGWLKGQLAKAEYRVTRAREALDQLLME